MLQILTNRLPLGLSCSLVLVSSFSCVDENAALRLYAIDGIMAETNSAVGSDGATDTAAALDESGGVDATSGNDATDSAVFDAPAFDLIEVSGDSSDVATLNDAVGGCTASATCPQSGLGPCLKAACIDGKCNTLPDNPAGKCDDGNPCTVEDVCDAVGTCAGKPKPCDNAGVCLKTNGSCAPTPSPMILIPKGEFWMGCNEEKDTQCNSDELPQHKVTLDAYYMESHEVTVAQYQKCVDSTKCDEPSNKCALSAPNDATWNKPGKENYPVNCVLWDHAKTYCESIGMRLPTEAEWERAARGGCELYPAGKCAKSEVKYPWGDADPDCDKANYFHSDYTWCKDGPLAPIGQFDKGKSPYGLQNMADGVWEWVSDWYAEGYYQEPAASGSQPTGPATGDKKVQRGGPYLFLFGKGSFFQPLRTSQRNWQAVNSTNSGASYGIRCARSWAQ